MQFTCNQLDLIVAINTVSKAITNRTANPILSCMLLKTEGEGRDKNLYLIGTDLELSIKSKIKANIISDGSIAVDEKLFSEIIRKIPEGIIEIDTDSNNYATIKSGKSEYKIAGQDGKDYPDIPVVERNDGITMFQNDLKDLIKSTNFSISKEETKPTLTGELIEIEKGIATLVAVDGFRISTKKANVSLDAKNVSAIIPGVKLNEIAKNLSSNSEDTFTMYFTDKNVLFELEDTIMIARLIDGKFINYKQNLVDNFDTQIKVNRLDLLNSVERISLISGIDKKQPIKLEIGDELVLTSNTTAGQGHEELEITKKGPDLIIAFNPVFLLDVLRAINEEEVTLTFKNSLSPCIIKCDQNDNYKYLILPLRINN